MDSLHSCWLIGNLLELRDFFLRLLLLLLLALLLLLLLSLLSRLSKDLATADHLSFNLWLLDLSEAPSDFGDCNCKCDCDSDCTGDCDFATLWFGVEVKEIRRDTLTKGV